MTVTKWGLSWECEIDLTNKNHLIHFIRKKHMITYDCYYRHRKRFG